MSEYALTNPYIYPGITSRETPPEPELPFQQAYSALHASPEPLQPFEPGLTLILPPFSTDFTPDRYADMYHSGVS